MKKNKHQFTPKTPDREKIPKKKTDRKHKNLKKISTNLHLILSIRRRRQKKTDRKLINMKKQAPIYT